MQIDSINLIAKIYPEVKFWVGIGGFFFAIFKTINWFKSIKENDLKQIHAQVEEVKLGLDTGLTDLKNALNTQTTSVVNELKELRADFRAYIPPPRMMARRKKAVRRREK